MSPSPAESPEGQLKGFNWVESNFWIKSGVQLIGLTDENWDIKEVAKIFACSAGIILAFFLKGIIEMAIWRDMNVKIYIIILFPWRNLLLTNSLWFCNINVKTKETFLTVTFQYNIAQSVYLFIFSFLLSQVSSCFLSDPSPIVVLPCQSLRHCLLRDLTC